MRIQRWRVRDSRGVCVVDLFVDDSAEPMVVATIVAPIKFTGTLMQLACMGSVVREHVSCVFRCFPFG